MHPDNNCGLRANERLHSKPQFAENGQSLCKNPCVINEGAAVWPLIGSVRGICLRPQNSLPEVLSIRLNVEQRMSSNEFFAVNADSHAEPAIISWMDH